MNFSSLCLFCLLAINLCTCNALFEWLFGEKKSDSDEGGRVIVTNGLKFEVQTADDKFLELKDALLDDLGQLNTCYHVVVYNLKKRCGDLTEEELGKVAVQLLNCQSAAEERRTYTCTNEMSIADCTREMDPTTWNSYHIISNRARSLCMSTQQQQFRKLTELTVNQLVATAHGQLEHLKHIQEGQEQLHMVTKDTVRKLYESQNDLLGNQEHLRSSQDDVLGQIKSNMDELKNEKALIAVGNKELAELTENIKQKLDATTEEFQRQEKSQFESQRKILNDLTNIHQKSQDALKKLDESSIYLSENHHEMLSHYELMYENMMRINTTVDHLLNTVQLMQKNLDDRINWFSHLLNVADDKLSMLTCGALHLAYFLCAALALSFLQSPTLSRVILFVLVVLNAVMEINCGQSLEFTAISVFMILVCLVNCLYNWWCRKFHNRWKKGMPQHQSGSLPAPEPRVSNEDEDRNQSPDTTTGGVPPVPLSPIEIRQLTQTLGRLYTSLNESPTSGGGDNSFTSPLNRSRPLYEPKPSTSAFTPVSRTERVKPDSSTVDDVAKVRRYLATLEENSSVGGDLNHSENYYSTPKLSGRPRSRNSSITSQSMCEGFTKAGSACRLSKARGSTHCYRHRDQDTSITSNDQ